MPTEVSISSNALLRLGADPINSFDEADNTGSNIERARLASNLWPSVRRAVLRGGTWNCATKRALLSPDATAPAFGYAYRFQRPTDWLRNVSLSPDPEQVVEFDFRVEGNFILTNEAVVYLVYIYDNTNPNTYDATLVAALETGMSAALAYPVTKSTSLAEAIAGELKDLLRDARNLDAQDDPNETLGDFPLYRARFGGYTGRVR